MDDLTGKIHDLLSLRVLMPLSRAQRLARPATRPTMSAFYEALRFRQKVHHWRAEEKREWVLRRLHMTARQANRETIYYHNLFKQLGFNSDADFSFEDFSRLPVLEREDVHRAGRDLVSRAVPTAQLRRDATGGSTGKPTEVWLGPVERGWGESGTEYFMRQINLPAGTRTGYLWGHHLDPIAQDSLRERYHTFESNTLWFDCFRLSPDVLEQYHQKFEEWRPACIIAYAAALGHLAEYILEKGYRPSYPTRAFVTGAEKLWPKHREAIGRAFGQPVHERYGSRDVGGIGFQLNPHRALDYTIDWANLLVEPETSAPDSPLLVTKLHADGMPMLRYRIGDVGRFPAGSAPGHPTFVLHEVLGRDLDRIWLPNGSWLHGIQLPHLMKDYPVREFMFFQRADYSVEVMIVPLNGFGDDARRRILETVAANLPSLDVSITVVESIPRTKANKWRPVVSEARSSQEVPA